MTLNEIYSVLQSSKKEQYSIYFLERKKLRNQITYSMIKTYRSQKIGDIFRNDAIKATRNIISREVVLYDTELSQQRNKIQQIAVKEVPNFNKIITSCQTQNSEHIQNISELSKNLWGYIIKIDVNEQQKIIYLFTKYTPAELVNSKKSIFQMKGRTLTPLKKSSALALNNDYNAIVMYSKENKTYSNIYIVSRIEFEEFFSYKEYYINYFSDNKDVLSQTNLVDNVNMFVERCSKNFPFSIRLARIIKNKKYESMNIKRVKKLITDHNIDVEIVDDRMKCDQKSAESILDILDDNYLNSPITSKKYKTKGSKIET